MLGWTICKSLKDAARRPRSTRRLQLWQPCVSIEECREVLRSLVALREFDVRWQSWTTLPPELAQLPKLKAVTALNAPIQGFPEFLASCPRLASLVLRGTDITTIPGSIEEFKNLVYFDLSNNPLSQVPEELGRLPKLKELALHGNGLCSVPQSLRLLRHLRHLGLTGNRFLPAEAAEIRGWFPVGVVHL